MNSQITVYTPTNIFVRNIRVNMVAAIDWCSHTTDDWIWLVSCFGFNGPLRQYFSLNRTVSQRGRKKREKIDERKKFQTTPTHTLCKRNTPLPYYYPNKWDAPALKVYPAPSHHPTTPSGLDFGESLSLSLKNNKLFGFPLVSRIFSKTTL